MRKVQQGFVAGEFSPQMYGRFDDTKYAQGLALCRNFITLPQGPATVRPGFAFVRAVKFSDKPTRIIPFTWSLEQTMVIELGDHYARFHTLGQTLLDEDGGPYEIVTPYAAEDVFGIHYVQSMDVMTLVHPNYPPQELRRYGATDWRIAAISFDSSLMPPAAPTCEFEVVAGDGVTITEEEKTRYTLKYKVTALVDTDGGTDESEASGVGSCEGNLYLNNATVTVTWTAVQGADRYRVYKGYKGLFCYIGETEETSFVDDNYEPDASITPPMRDDELFGEGNYPSAVAYFEQRRCFGGTEEKPQTIWMTRSGTESDMSFTIPSQDDNRIRFRLAAQEASRILHMLPLSHLILLTNSTEYRAASGITPTDIDVKPQSYVGASDVQPVLVNSTLVYASARDGHMRELGYNWQSSGFTTGDLSVRATHLFEADRVVDMGLQKSPDPIVWAVMASGTLVGLTYMPEQSVSGWHKHVTQNGAFESVAVVAEGNEDIVYCVVRREINGETVRYVERMHERLVSSLSDSFFVDCGGTYRGDPTTEISGLSWLEGQTVSILADGCVLPRQTVQSGKVTIPMEASVVHVGLPITADLQTLPVAVQMSDGSYYQGHMKNITEVWTRVYQSSGLFVGPDFDHLIEAKQRTTEPYGSPPDLMNREVSVVAAPAWTDSGQICIRQSDPLPLTIVSVSFELAE